jgi:hypothetical protein
MNQTKAHNINYEVIIFSINEKSQSPTSKTHINCLTASAVPWNHFFPASPGVWVAAKTCLPFY